MSRILSDLQLKLWRDAVGRPIPTRDGRAQWLGGDPPLEVLDDDGWKITNPPGEPTDLGSIPQWSWSLGFSPDGVGAPGFVIHDLLYRTRGACTVSGVAYRERPAAYSRAEADALLRSLLCECGVGALRRNAIYWAVRLGGRGGWGR